MALANAQNILRIPGRLCSNPTDLTTAYPHGGTALGVVRDMVFHFSTTTTLSTGEEWGGVVTKAFYTGEVPFLSCVLREYDDDALAAVFPNTSTGTVTQDQVISFTPTSGNRPGYSLGNKELKLCFSPLSEDKHPFIIIYAALPSVDDEATLMLSYDEEIGFPVTFWAAVDSSGRTYRIGRGQDLNPLL